MNKEKMTPAQSEAARRAVGSKRFRWMPGMLHEFTDKRGCRYYNRVDEKGRVWGATCSGLPAPSVGCGAGCCLPVVSDAATRGCLLALVREAWGDPHTSTRWVVAKRMWLVDPPARETPEFFGRTEVEALVAALEAAP